MAIERKVGEGVLGFIRILLDIRCLNDFKNISNAGFFD